MIRCSVGELAAFAGRGGDLGAAHFSLLRGAQGIRAHQRIQRAPDAGRSEIPVEFEYTGITETLALRGRIDLIRDTPDGPVLEEIKTTRLPENEMPLDAAIHRLQALLYAWMLWGQTPYKSPIRFRVRYIPPDDGEGWFREWGLSPDELCQEATAACERFLVYKEQIRQWRALRNASLAELAFPLAEPRESQLHLMRAVGEILQGGGRLYAEAPTGTGKTLAVLLPALRALGQGRIGRLMVLTSRNSGKAVFTETLALLVAQGARLRALTLVAKERSCRYTGSPCDCTACPMALGFYDRLPAALEALRGEASWDAMTCQRIAEREGVCPYAFQMAAAREADLLLGDVNHAFDPAARLAFAFEDPDCPVALLIDEAHQLPERARGMYSASLDPVSLRRAVGGLSPVTRKVLAALRAYEREEVEDPGPLWKSERPPLAVAEACRSAAEQIEAGLGTERIPGDPRFEMIRDLRAFWLCVENRNDSHVTYRDEQGFHFFCRDPAPGLRDVMESVHATILFSATLRPMPVFRRLTGALPENRELVLPSPFDPARFRVEVETAIPTAFRARGPEMYDRITARIRTFLEADPGKSLVFFPSYAFLGEIRKRLPEDDMWLGRIVAQPRGMQEADTVDFLRPFRESPGAITGLAVLSGALNEGIDLPGEALRAVVVVGIGLPALSPRQELLVEYHKQRGEDGFGVAYTVPGLIRVLQALGRVIRGPEDRGRALLIDPRYTHPFYREHLPIGC